jgi:hypothetical protein
MRFQFIIQDSKIILTESRLKKEQKDEYRTAFAADKSRNT